MNEEDNKPTYGELYVENFRLEHNYRVVLEREAKLQNNWNELKKWLQIRNKCFCEEEILEKMQEMEQGKDENNK